MATIKSKIKSTGHSLCVILNKNMLKNTYGLGLDDEIEITFAPKRIILKKAADEVRT